MTEHDIQDKIENLGNDIKWLSPNEPITIQGVRRVLEQLDSEIRQIELQTGVATTWKTSEWKSNVTYSKNDVVLFFCEDDSSSSETKYFVFVLMSKKNNNKSIPEYGIQDGVPRFSNSDWKMLDYKSVSKEYFQLLLEDNSNERKSLMDEMTTKYQNGIKSGLMITMWSPNVTYSKNDIVLYYKQESKQISPDVGKRDFVFIIISQKDNNDSIPNYELIDGIPNFSKTNWRLINPTSYLLQDLIEMKSVVKGVFQSVLDEHVKENHNLMNGTSIEQNLLKKNYSNLITPWELGKYSVSISSNVVRNDDGIKITEKKDSTGIMECFVVYGFDTKANPQDEEICIQDKRYYYQSSPIWDESDKTIFAQKYIDQDVFSIILQEHNNEYIQFNNLRYGTNIFHRRVDFETPFVDDQYCVFFDTYGNGEFVFGYDKDDLESKTEPTYDEVVSMPMLMNKSKSGFDIVLPIHTHFNSVRKYNIGVPWNNKFRLQAIGRFR